ncbi:MAG: hypothetical protein AB9883_05095 [Acidaminococcaceae bacterium]
MIYLKAGVEEVTGLLHISDRLLADDLSRVEAARGTLRSLPFLAHSNRSNPNF